MSQAALHLLWVDEYSPPILSTELALTDWGSFLVERCDSLEQAAERLGIRGYDLLLAALPSERATCLSAWAGLSSAVMETAVVVLAPSCPPAAAIELVQRGVQDVVLHAQWAQHGLARSLRWALERHRLDRSTRKAQGLDVATGLPNRSQLLEHMSHLLALRQREPSPMALLVLRVTGLAALRERLGREGVHVLRRRLAVRLRAGVRASDVVAALGPDTFAVLLSSTERADDAPSVARKLRTALHRPFSVAGEPHRVDISVGVALYPLQAQDAAALLRLASAAAATPAAPLDNVVSLPRSRARPAAANDEDPAA